MYNVMYLYINNMYIHVPVTGSTFPMSPSTSTSDPNRLPGRPRDDFAACKLREKHIKHV